MKILKVFKNQYFYLGLILIVAFLVRLYKVDAPIADWHSWRQADTAAVTRNFIKDGFNPVLPKYDDMSGASETPLANVNRFRFVEFPLYNIAVYPLYLLFGVNDIYHRLVSIFFSLGSIIFIFLVAKKYAGVLTALLSALISALLPFNVFFSRTTLPEPTFVFFALGMIYFMDSWIWERKRIWMFWGFVFSVLAFLIKPWAIFFYLPLLYSVYKQENRKAFLFRKFIPATLILLLPFILWRFWILQQPEGIPASKWLLNGDNIRFRPAFFWWIISERLGREILGVTGFVLLVLGVLIKPKNRNYFLHFFLLSIFLYFVTFATGNVRHNYYQILFVPIASIFVSLGFISLIKNENNFIIRFWTIPIAFALFFLSFYFSYKMVKEFYKINNPIIIEVGKITDSILPSDALVLAPYNGDTAFLYQTNRAGWPVVPLSIKEMVVDYGITHYVSVSKDNQANWVKRHFEVLVDDPKFIIANLQKVTLDFDDINDPQP